MTRHDPVYVVVGDLAVSVHIHDAGHHLVVLARSVGSLVQELVSVFDNVFL